MICPKDMVQMHQLDKVGYGWSAEESYGTEMVLTCPSCGLLALESYNCKFLTKEMLEKYKEEIKTKDGQ